MVPGNKLKSIFLASSTSSIGYQAHNTVLRFIILFTGHLVLGAAMEFAELLVVVFFDVPYAASSPAATAVLIRARRRVGLRHHSERQVER